MTTDNTDFYETLGITKNASADQIKKAYRSKAMKYHPDRNQNNQNAGEKFKEISRAYEVLSDDNKRSRYDQFGHAGVDGATGGGQSPDMGGFGDAFSDIFENFFGGGMGGGNTGRSRAARGRDLIYALEITLEEALHGCKKNIKINTLTQCNSCKGSGAKSGTKPKTCGTCQGMGRVQIQQGFIAMQQTCPDCHGQGKVIGSPCSDCRGQGRVQKPSTISINIPCGIDNGDQMRVPNKGEAGSMGGPSGDLFVEIKLKPHDIFERDEHNLICEIPVDFSIAALGGSIEIPTMGGKVKLKIPAETQSGSLFRIRGKGMPKDRSGKSVRSGDLLCKIIIETPVNLNSRQKEMVRNLADDLANNAQKHAPKARSWLDKVSNFFTNNN